MREFDYVVHSVQHMLWEHTYWNSCSGTHIYVLIGIDLVERTYWNACTGMHVLQHMLRERIHWNTYWNSCFAAHAWSESRT